MARPHPVAPAAPAAPVVPVSETSPDLRAVMRSFATGVCVASTYTDRADGRHHDAVTINSLSSVSLDPPLVSVCLRVRSPFLTDLLATGRWAVSILPYGDREIARLLAGHREVRAGAVSALPASPGPRTGALVLGSSSWLECELWETFDLGDHTLVVGEVVMADSGRDGPPLLFVDGGYCLPVSPSPSPPGDAVRLDEWW